MYYRRKEKLPIEVLFVVINQKYNLRVYILYFTDSEEERLDSIHISLQTRPNKIYLCMYSILRCLASFLDLLPSCDPFLFGTVKF